MTMRLNEIAELSVNETIRLYPQTVALFKRYGIDACCGGAATVLHAAERHGVDVDALTAEIQLAIGERQ